MPYKYIAVEVVDGVASLVLNRPEALNALSYDMFGEIKAALDDIRDGGQARALLITGAGRAFSSGADLVNTKAGREQSARPVDGGGILEEHVNPLIERLFDLPMPVVAAVNGAAVGAGCSIALAADFVLAARSAFFLCSFANVGLVPDGGLSWMLPHMIGRSRALRMLMLGERISASQAEQWGMVHEVVEGEGLADAAHTLAARLAAGPTVSFALTRRCVRRALDATLTETLQMERAHQRIASGTEDFVRGVTAFREKRTPDFQGR